MVNLVYSIQFHLNILENHLSFIRTFIVCPKQLPIISTLKVISLLHCFILILKESSHPLNSFDAILQKTYTARKIGHLDGINKFLTHHLRICFNGLF